MSGRLAKPQLTLDLFNVARHDFASFIAGANAEALAAVSAWSRGLLLPAAVIDFVMLRERRDLATLVTLQIGRAHV